MFRFWPAVHPPAHNRTSPYGLLVPVAGVMTPQVADQVTQILDLAGIRSTTASSARLWPGRRYRRMRKAHFPLHVLVFAEDAPAARRAIWTWVATDDPTNELTHGQTAPPLDGISVKPAGRTAHEPQR